jgi:RND superfamily putative drug exporter
MRVIGGVGILMFLLGLAGGSYQGKLASVQKNDNSAFLPASAESTKAQNESDRFNPTSTIPGFLVYERAGGLTAQDRAKIAGDLAAVRKIDGVDATQILGVQFSKDGTAASISVPLVAKRGKVSVNGVDLSNIEKKVQAIGARGNPPGLAEHTAGAGGLLVALIDSFQGIDGKLLGIAGLVVIILLLFVYRSPVLWFFPLLSAVLALGLSSLFIYFLAKNNVITLNGQSQGILSVLVIGAGTDYALLLISRYREELHVYPSRVDAMIVAWKGAAPAIGASALTVILGLLCLLASQLNSNRGLGPVCAIGIACTVVVMLTFLPLALVTFGRWIFWPRRPMPDPDFDLAEHGLWGRISDAIGRRHRISWIVTAIVLLGCVTLISGLRSSGLSITQGFTNTPDAVTGQKLYDAKFNQGAGTPVVITVAADKVTAVRSALTGVAGVAGGAGAICVQPDYKKVAAAVAAHPSAARTTGCVPAALSIAPQNGRTVVNVAINYAYDSAQAYATVNRIRTKVHAIADAQALVGGESAVNLDQQNASRHDRNVIIPLVLLVILIVLGVLLRAIVAPILLIVTVVLSFTATLGVSAFVFNHIFHFANSDPSFPLYAFIFLVALGIDYNIFLMTRVREESLQFGTPEGVLRGLAVTGGVITSAGLVLASTFAVLGVLPLVFLAEIGFAVAFGVLMDTILVRSILVPALSYDIGSRIWWPSKLSRA